LPVASEVWERLISLPIFPGMSSDEIDSVIGTVKRLCREFRKSFFAFSASSVSSALNVSHD
jgi:hypothetical protein